MCFVTLSRFFTIHFKKQIYKRFNVLCCHTVTFVQSLFHGYTLNRFKVFSLKNMLKIITKKKWMNRFKDHHAEISKEIKL